MFIQESPICTITFITIIVINIYHGVLYLHDSNILNQRVNTLEFAEEVKGTQLLVLHKT